MNKPKDDNQAMWIWHTHGEDADSRMIRFGKTFEAEKLPAQYTLQVCADSRYILAGQRAQRYPAAPAGTRTDTVMPIQWILPRISGAGKTGLRRMSSTTGTVCCRRTT